MVHAMTAAAMTRSLERARRSWRGQLAVVGLGALLLAPVLHGISDGGQTLARSIVVFIELLALLVGSVRIAGGAHSGSFARESAVLARLLPRALAQAIVVIAPLVTLVALAMRLSGLAPLLVLVVVPIALASAAVTSTLLLLVAGASGAGDELWLPRRSLRAMRDAPLQVLLAGVVGGVAACAASLPLVVVALVLGALAGPAGAVGAGLAFSAVVACLGCVAYALWSVAGCAVDHPADPHLVDGVPGSRGGLGWAEAGSWQVALEPGVASGGWVQLEFPSLVVLQLRWTGATPPELSLVQPDGATIAVQAATAGGDQFTASLPAGPTWVQLRSRAAHPQVSSITMHVAAAAHAA